jgi:hypothetical protein
MFCNEWDIRKCAKDGFNSIQLKSVLPSTNIKQWDCYKNINFKWFLLQSNYRMLNDVIQEVITLKSLLIYPNTFNNWNDKIIGIKQMNFVWATPAVLEPNFIRNRELPGQYWLDMMYSERLNLKLSSEFQFRVAPTLRPKMSLWRFLSVLETLACNYS